jgi:hypothetical protein
MSINGVQFLPGLSMPEFLRALWDRPAFAVIEPCA